MRILPRVCEEVNEEWISDKSRQAFDGLKKQRLSYPMLRRKDGGFDELKWDEAMEIARREFAKVEGDEISAIVGNFVDVEGACALRDLVFR